MRPIKFDQSLPVIRRSIREPELHAAGSGALRAGFSQLRWRALEAFLESIVEAPERRKDGAPRHGANRQRGLGDQPAREVEPIGIGDLFGRAADLRLEEPPQVSRAQAEPPGEFFFSVAAKLVGGDQLERSLNYRGLAPPCQRKR